VTSSSSRTHRHSRVRSLHESGRSGRDANSVEAVVPPWEMAIGSSCIPLLTVARYLGRRRPLGLCLTCGYDLRATPDRCPECGEIPPQNG
jgi:hypothetical protein